MSRKRALIVGGGIGGLTAAIALRRIPPAAHARQIARMIDFQVPET